MKVKLVLSVIAALFAALAIGWLWGSAGRWEAQRTLQRSELRSDLFDGRGLALAARVDIFEVNFGEASRHLEGARSALQRASANLRALDRTEDVTRIDLALARLDEAQKLAGQLNQQANPRAAEAALAIGEVISNSP
jgi:hypothetical protein